MNYNHGAQYNKGIHYNSAPTNFKDIFDAEGMVLYLRDSARRLDNSKYIHHYTSLKTAINILKTKQWHLANAQYANDQLEYENGDQNRWPRIFFSSFMADRTESIGMWCMYAQPWEQGIRISIPSGEARRWIADTTRIEEISISNKKPTGRSTTIKEADLCLSAVVYCDTDREHSEDTFENVTWSNVTNKKLHNVAHISQLTGYVKDMAWSYEKETRIRLEFNQSTEFQRVAISIPEFVLEKIIITASPRFKGSLEEQLFRKLEREFQTDTSLFEDKLKISSICDNCILK